MPEWFSMASFSFGALAGLGFSLLWDIAAGVWPRKCSDCIDRATRHQVAADMAAELRRERWKSEAWHPSNGHADGCPHYGASGACEHCGRACP